MVTNAPHDILTIIQASTDSLDIRHIRKVLILYEEKIQFIGDCCKRFDKLSYVRQFLNDATITINFQHPENQKFYEGLLKNNPAIDSVTTDAWEKIDFAAYDLLYCIAYNEEHLLHHLEEGYGELIRQGSWCPAVYSLSATILKPVLHSRYIFQEHTGLIREVSAERPGRLYISAEEQAWARCWLQERGLQPAENLFILLDSTTAREKLIDITVYFDLLTYLLENYAGKVLVFDEGNIGKEQFYAEWLGPDAMQRIMVSKGLSLRQNLCLIGATQTRLMLGPCTGLMHCASAIYNQYVATGMDPQDVPVLITYTGTYAAENIGAHFWWGSSPLINCLLLKRTNQRISIVELASLTPEQQLRNDSLPCDAYTLPLLTGYLQPKLAHLRKIAVQS